MNEQRFKKFFAASRRGRPTMETPERFGFATRVAAQWVALSRRDDPLGLLERFARWGVGLTVACCVAAAVWLQPSPEPGFLADLSGVDAEAGELF